MHTPIRGNTSQAENDIFPTCLPWLLASPSASQAKMTTQHGNSAGYGSISPVTNSSVCISHFWKYAVLSPFAVVFLYLFVASHSSNPLNVAASFSPFSLFVIWRRLFFFSLFRSLFHSSASSVFGSFLNYGSWKISQSNNMFCQDSFFFFFIKSPPSPKDCF